MAKPNKRKRRLKNRKNRVDALTASQEAERERERERPKELAAKIGLDQSQIPTKTVRVGRAFEAQAELEDEWFGEFRETRVSRDPDKIDEVVEPGVWRKSGRGLWRQRVEPSVWVRVWGRGSRAPGRWAAEPTRGLYPCDLRAEWEAYGKGLPRHGDPESDRAEHLAALENAGEVSLGAPGAAMRAVELAEHYERRVQRFVATWYKPSRAIEEKRFRKVKLPRVELKLFPKEPPGRMLGFGSRLECNNALRAELDSFATSYQAFVGDIPQCPAETTTAVLNKRKVGRPPIGERAMTNRKKQKAWYWRDKERREKLRLITEPPSPGETYGSRIAEAHKCHVNPKVLGGGNCANSKTAG